jgi:hypothetical protein
MGCEVGVRTGGWRKRRRAKRGSGETGIRDFGPTLAAEYLEKDLQISLSRETLRQLMIREGIWKAKTQKISGVHVSRPRRSCQGELVQWDTSVQAWLEDRGASPRCRFR